MGRTGDKLQFRGMVELLEDRLTPTVVRFHTVLGIIDVDLFEEQTPITVANFLQYMNAELYDSSIIHRSVQNPAGTLEIVQGGSYQFLNGNQFSLIPPEAPILNEPGISNTRGTIAMAKVGGDPNSATSGWFFNVGDNSANLDSQNGGFTVFGQIIAGLDVLDAIAALPTVTLSVPPLTFQDFPLRDWSVGQGVTADNLVLIQSITLLDTTPPTITDVHVRGTNWNASFLSHLETTGVGHSDWGFRLRTDDSQLHALPWNNLNQIHVTFSEDVMVAKEDLALVGTLGTYDVAAATFAYDSTTFTASWTFPTAFGRDKLLISIAGVTDLAGNALDGEYLDDLPTGDGTAGGDFFFRFNILPGNAIVTSNNVAPTDWNFVRARLFQSAGLESYTIFADVNGDGQINPLDWNFVRSRLFTNLNDVEEPGDPGEPLFATSALAAWYDPSTITQNETSTPSQQTVRTRPRGVLEPATVDALADELAAL